MTADGMTERRPKLALPKRDWPSTVALAAFAACATGSAAALFHVSLTSDAVLSHAHVASALSGQSQVLMWAFNP